MFFAFHSRRISFLGVIANGLSATLLLSSCTTSLDKKRESETKKPMLSAPTKKLEGDKVQSSVLGSAPVQEQAVPEYRNVSDEERLSLLYAESQTALESGDLRKAEGLWNQYVTQAPTGQYVDLVSMRLADMTLGRHDYHQAALNFQRVSDLDPPSRYRAQALYGWSKAEKLRGNNTKALEILGRINFSEFPLPLREEVFGFWAQVSADEGRWLESSLASIKAYWESRSDDAQRKHAALVKEQIDRRLVEGELHFILKEYGNRFPINEVRVRLATLYLARSEKSQAENLLNDVLGASPAGSENHNRAKELLQRLNTLGSVSVFKIGALLPLSGRQAPLGQAVAAGLQLAFAGQKIELVLADSGPSRDSLKLAYERLVLEDRVMAVVGPMGGEDGEMVAQWSVQYGVPNINLASRSGIIEKGEYVFRTALTPEKQVQALVQYAKEKLNAKKFAVLFPEDNFGETYAKAYFNAVRKAGARVTAAESYDPAQTDFKAQIDNMTGKAFPAFRQQELQNMYQAEAERLGRELTARDRARIELPPIVDFDVLFIPDTYRPLGQIVPALLYADVKSPVLMGPATWRNPQLLDRAGQYLSRAILVDAFAPDRKNDVTQSFAEKFQVQNGAVPNSLNAIGYDVGLALVAAYTRNPANREALRARLENLGEIQGALGKHKWNQDRDTLAELQLFRPHRGAFLHQGSVEF